MGRLGRLLAALDRRRLPVHVTPVVRSTIEAIAAEAPAAAALPLRALLQPWLTDRVLDRLGERGKFFDPVLHNTASATILSGGHSHNVIPGEVAVTLDCRLLPGFGPDEVMEELRRLAGVELEFEVLRFDPGPPAPDMGLFDTLSGLLRELDPAARPIPFLFPRLPTVASSRGSGSRHTDTSPCDSPTRCDSWSSSMALTSAFP